MVSSRDIFLSYSTPPRDSCMLFNRDGYPLLGTAHPTGDRPLLCILSCTRNYWLEIIQNTINNVVSPIELNLVVKSHDRIPLPHDAIQELSNSEPFGIDTTTIDNRAEYCCIIIISIAQFNAHGVCLGWTCWTWEPENHRFFCMRRILYWRIDRVNHNGSG